MAAATICSDFGTPQNKVCHCFPCFPIYLHEVMGPDAIILVFWRLSFKPTFSLSSLTFIKRLFSYSSLSAIRVVSSAYLKLLIFLPAILSPAGATFSPMFLPMNEYSGLISLRIDWFDLLEAHVGKGVHQGCILSPCLFNLYAEYIMRNAGLEEAEAGIKIVGRNINNLK